MTARAERAAVRLGVPALLVGPVELSLRGARWTEELRDVGGDFLTRQADAEARALRAHADRMEEIQILGQELKRDDLALEELVNWVVERIDALEEKVEGRSSRR